MGASEKTGLDMPLPSQWYRDASRFETERDLIFRRSWQVAGLLSEVAEPSSFMACDISGVPVVVTRDDEGELHAMVNVCPHRGTVIKDGSGSAKLLVCPNHAWSFDLTGDLRSAPRTDSEPDYPCEGLRLSPVAVSTWGPLVLVNLDADADEPTAELAIMTESLERYGVDPASLSPMGDAIDWEMECDWKILVENYLECYHCAVVHRDFSQVIDVSPERYSLEPHGKLLSATAPVRETSKLATQQALLETTAGPVIDSHWHMLFPATTVNIYPGEGAVEITWYWPVGAGRSSGRTVILLAPGVTEAYAKQMIGLGVKVTEEDNDLCERMQRGMASGAITHSRPLPNAEALVIAFHRLVREATV